MFRKRVSPNHRILYIVTLHTRYQNIGITGTIMSENLKCVFSVFLLCVNNDILMPLLCSVGKLYLLVEPWSLAVMHVVSKQ